jgi:biotin carboxylase
MNDRQAVLAAARELSSRAGGFDRVVSQEEHWIDLEAALRAELGVRGPKPDDIQPYRRKSLMKEVFRRAGVPVARGRVLDALSGALALAREAGFPLIAKPDQGVGAHATYKLEDEGELRGFFERGKPAVPYIFEEFLEGSIQSFDGLTDREGRVVFSACHQFGTDIMSVVNRDDHLHYWSMRELPKDLEEHGSKAIAAFGLRERFFHLEFIRGPQGRLTAMEVNARPPGGLTMDMFDYANDIDLFKEWANVLVRGRFEARFDRPYHVSYVGRKSNKRYAHSHEEVLERGGGMIVAHTPIDSVFRRAIGDYAYLARAKSLDELRPFVEFAQELAP